MPCITCLWTNSTIIRSRRGWMKFDELDKVMCISGTAHEYCVRYRTLFMTSKLLECSIRALLSAVVVFTYSANGTAQHVRKKKAHTQYRLKAPPAPTLGCEDYYTVGFIPDIKVLSKPVPVYPEEVRAKR